DGLAAVESSLRHKKPPLLHSFRVFTGIGGAFLGELAQKLAGALFSEKGDERRAEKANAEIGTPVHRLGDNHVGKEAGNLGGLDICPIRHFLVASNAVQIGCKLNDGRMFWPFDELRFIRYLSRPFT